MSLTSKKNKKRYKEFRFHITVALENHVKFTTKDSKIKTIS